MELPKIKYGGRGYEATANAPELQAKLESMSDDARRQAAIEAASTGLENLDSPARPQMSESSAFAAAGMENEAKIRELRDQYVAMLNKADEVIKSGSGNTRAVDTYRFIAQQYYNQMQAMKDGKAPPEEAPLPEQLQGPAN